MNKKARMRTFVLLLLIFVILGGIITAVILIRRGENLNMELTNLKIIYVDAEDKMTSEKLITDFVVVINNTVVATGKTNLKGHEEISIPIIPDKNIYILNYGNQCYVGRTAIMGNSATLDLYKIGEVKVNSIISNITSDDVKNININISSINGQMRQIGFCVNWGISFLEVWNEEYLQGEFLETEEKCENYNLKWLKINDTHSKCELEYANIFPRRLKDKYERCYYIQDTLAENESISFNLKYETFQELVELDELEMVIFDSDRNFQNKYITEDANFENVGMEDYHFILDYNCLKYDKCESIECEGNYCTLS